MDGSMQLDPQQHIHTHYAYRYNGLPQGCIYVARSAPSDPNAWLLGCLSGTVGRTMNVQVHVSMRLDPHNQIHSHGCLDFLQEQ
jgi:hypothetical protein